MSLRSSQWFRRAAIGVTAVALLLLGLRALVLVMNGEAGGTYTNVKGVHITWGSALVFVTAVIVSLAAALVARWWQSREVASSRNGGSSAAQGNLRSNTSLERTREG